MKRQTWLVFLGLCAAAPLVLLGGDAEKVQFVDDRFEDFAAGKLDAGGQNIYACRDGTLRTINRFDLNDDGHLDVIYNCTHDTYQMLPATVGHVRDGKTVSLDLAVEGSQRVAVGDLNKDGYTDLIICPNAIGVHHERRFVSIAWGGADGWTAQRINGVLPMNGASAVAVVDLNRDGWPDIAVLGGQRWRADQPDGQIIRVYWGGASGFSVTAFQDLGVTAAIDLAAADFDGDGSPDLAVLRNDGKLTIFWSTKSDKTPVAFAPAEITLPGKGICLASGDMNGDKRPDLVIGTAKNIVFLLQARPERLWDKTVSVSAYPATHVAVGDLDGDGQPDIVLTQSSQARAAGGEQAGISKEAQEVIHVLWGGKDFGQTDSLKIPYAVATAIGAIDGDKRADLIVAIHQGEKTFNGTSRYFTCQGRRFTPSKGTFQTSGTTDVAYVPTEKGLPARAVFCNSIGGHLDEAVPVHVFWGGPDGFDPNRLWKIPFHSGYEASAADLNADGFVDLILLNSGHAGESAHRDPTLGANIFWGGKDGFDLEKKRTVLHEHFLGTSSVADLNRDGYLDLVLEAFAPEKPGEADKLVIYYGGADGFPRTRRVEFPKEGYGQEHLVADFNGDGWLDLGLTSRKFHCVRLWWGGPDGFDPKREQRLNVSGALGVDAADLNGDGYLDLVIGSYDDPVSGHRDMGLIIFWGGPKGYRHDNAQWLPGFAPLGRTIADFDGDGYLDIFSPQHSGELTREDLACHIYWGSKEGFSTRRRTTIFADSVNDSMAADFNGDGLIDLAVNCHTRHGDHRTMSRIFYNDGKRFTDPKVQKLPTNGPHLMWATDVGHIHHRKYQQHFESRVFAWDQPARGGTLVSKAEVPTKATLTFFVRAAPTEDGLSRQEWKKVEKGEFVLGRDDRRLQYRAAFHSSNGDRYPVLDRAEIGLRR